MCFAVAIELLSSDIVLTTKTVVLVLCHVRMREEVKDDVISIVILPGQSMMSSILMLIFNVRCLFLLPSGFRNCHGWLVCEFTFSSATCQYRDYGLSRDLQHLYLGKKKVPHVPLAQAGRVLLVSPTCIRDAVPSLQYVALFGVWLQYLDLKEY